MNDQNDLEEIEEELKEEAEEKKTGQKVSGRSVFEIQRIIAKKGEDSGRDDPE